MPRPFLTVLTATVPGARQQLVGELRRRVRRYVKPGVPLPAVSPYPGHYALVRSVVEGLRAIGADFNFNPRRLSEVEVLEDVAVALRLRGPHAGRRIGDVIAQRQQPKFHELIVFH